MSRRVGRRTQAGVTIALLLVVPQLHAQSAPVARPPAPPRVTLALGGLLRGAEGLGTRTATLRANASGTAMPPPVTLVRADARLGAASGADVRVAVAAGRGLALELTGRAARPLLQVDLTGDPEAPAQTIDAEHVAAYAADLAIVWQPRRRGRGPRVQPLLSAGVGVLRHLHEGRLLAEDGTTRHVAAGLLWRRRRVPQARVLLGLRMDVRYEWRRGGTGVDDARRGHPSAALLAVLGR